MASGKITRKEIKRNEFATTVGGVASVVERNSKAVGIAVGALVLLAVAVIFGYRYSAGQRDASILSLAAVQRAEASPVVASAAGAAPAAGTYATREAKYNDVVRLADVVLTQYPSSAAARWAAFYKALGKKELGASREALDGLEPIVAAKDNEFLSCSARMLKAEIQESTGDLASAAQTYADLVASAPASFPLDMALAAQARVLEAKGDTEGAAQVHRRLSQEYPTSPFAPENLSPGRG